jgi:dsRNA-specific ribonuclease
MSKYNSRNDLFDEGKLSALENKLGICISDKWLLKSAITSEKTSEADPNLILENIHHLAFLGDSVLYFIVSQYLYNKHACSNKSSINLHEEREKYRKNMNLEKLVSKHKLYDYFCFKERYRRDPPSKNWTKLMATFIEAIIGATYQDKHDIRAPKKLIENFIIPNLDEII